MKELRLIRLGYLPEYTEGALMHREVGNQGWRFMCWTIERPWLGNEPFKSCIPAGDYLLRPHVRPNGDKVYILHGGTVSMHKDETYERYGILFHTGNTAADLAGCVAPGLDRKPGRVVRSRDAMATMRRELKDHFTLQGTMPLTISLMLDPSLPPRRRPI